MAIVSVIQGLEWTFHTVAEEYNRWRPGYVPELYQDLFAYKPLNKSSSALEIGIGTGQATAPVLETGCALTAVELGDSLAEIARRKFSRYPRFTVIHTAFQAYARPDESFDLIYAAGSFHWIPEEIGYPKVYRMLKRGGAFARFAVHPYYRKGNEPMYTDIQKVYAAYMPRSSHRTSTPKRTLGSGRQSAPNTVLRMCRIGFTAGRGSIPLRNIRRLLRRIPIILLWKGANGKDY